MSSALRPMRKACHKAEQAIEPSRFRRHPVLGVAGILLGAAAVVGIIAMMPDIARYIRIKTM